MLKGAFIGFGNVARFGHLQGWLGRDNVEIVAVADLRPDGREDLFERLPGARWYDSVEEMLGSEKLDFVDVCTPPALHSAGIRAALDHGLHVLCEKPLVLSMEELEGLAALARRQDRVLATVHNWRHAPVLARAAELVSEGVIGAIRGCRWETLRDRPAASSGITERNWRVDPAIAGGGILVDHGWHALYMVQSWLPGEPLRVSAKLETRRHREWPIEDTATVLLEYPRRCAHSEESHRESAPASEQSASVSRIPVATTDAGPRCEIFLTWTAAERANRVVLEGELGTIVVDGETLEVSSLGVAASRQELPGSLARGSHHPEWFGGVVEDFLGEIREPARRGASLEQARRCLRWIRAAQESSRRAGAPVSMFSASSAATAGVAS